MENELEEESKVSHEWTPGGRCFLLPCFSQVSININQLPMKDDKNGKKTHKTMVFPRSCSRKVDVVLHGYNRIGSGQKNLWIIN